MTASPGPNKDRVSIVIPALNEEGNIREALANATRVAERLFAGHEIIVVDDGSSDKTAAIVTELAESDPRIQLISHPENRGYGEALRSGFVRATLELVFVTDADNQFDLDELEEFLPWIERVDLVAGYRIRRQDRLLRRVIAKAWNWIVRVLFYVPVRDIDCAFKLFRRPVLDAIELESMGAMFNTELMVKLARNGASLIEIGVTHYPRRHGVPSGASPRVIWMAVRELFKIYRRLARTEVAGP